MKRIYQICTLLFFSLSKLEILVQIFNSCLVFTPSISPNKTKASLSSTLLPFHVTDSSVLSTQYMAISKEYANELHLSPTCIFFQNVTNVSSIDRPPSLLASHYFLPISSFSIMQIALMVRVISNIKNKKLIPSCQEPRIHEIG